MTSLSVPALPPLGLTDQPSEEDLLSVSAYIRGIAEFMQRCPTPMTLAVQGDWGSGKTTTLAGIKSQLSKYDDHPRIIEFNTWQYSQFDLGDRLVFSLLDSVLGNLEEYVTKKDSVLVKKLKESRSLLWRVSKNSARALLDVAASAVNADGLVNAIADGYQKSTAENDSASTHGEDNIELVTTLRDQLASVVNSIITETPNDENSDGVQPGRVFVFVDDLDRLPPARAVELMEALKVFLDVQGLVFVLAIDFDVVVQGVKDRYQSLGDEKGRSFFDKIIQVPFNLPVNLYHVRGLIEEGLGKSGAFTPPNDSEDEYEDIIDGYAQLVEHSVGRNPRAVKRLLNTFTLLMVIGKHVGQDPDVPAGEYEHKDTFAVLCLQEAFPAFFSGLARRSDKAGYSPYLEALTVACLSGGAENTEETIDAETLEQLERLTTQDRTRLGSFLHILAKQFGFPIFEPSGVDIFHSIELVGKPDVEERLSKALLNAMVTAVGLTRSETESVQTPTYGKPVPRDARRSDKERDYPLAVSLSDAFEDELNERLGPVDATVGEPFWNYGIVADLHHHFSHPDRNPQSRFAELSHSRNRIRCAFGSYLSEDELDDWVTKGTSRNLTVSRLKKSKPPLSIKGITDESSARRAAQLVAESFLYTFNATDSKDDMPN